MVPDRGFTRQLHALDPELEVVWNGWGDKWEIWRFPRDGKPPFHYMTVQTKDRTYRELGTDILLRLAKSDPARFTTSALINYFDELDNQVQRRKRKEFLNKMESMILETQRYARGNPFTTVPAWIKKDALKLDVAPGSDVYIDLPKQQKVRRVIANA